MGLVFAVMACHVYRIVGKLRYPVETGFAESACCCRIKVCVECVGRIIFVDYFCHSLEPVHSIERYVVGVKDGQEIAVAGFAVDKTGRIPLVCGAVDFCVEERLCAPEIVGHIV